MTYSPSVTHSTLAHLRAVRHTRRAVAWSRVLPVSRVLERVACAVRVIRGRQY